MSIMKEKMLNVKLPLELHKELKIQSIKREQSLKVMVEKALRDFLKKLQSEEQDEDWDRLMKSIEVAPEEEPDEIDLKIMERAKWEKERGEIEDYEDDLKELEDESSDN